MYQQRISGGSRKQFLGITDRRVIEKAVLGRSFLLYGPSAAFEQAEWTNGEELLRSLRVQLWFPVLSEARVLGAIMIERRENGSYEWAGNVYGGNTTASIEAFIEVAHDSTICRMSAMLFPATGQFAILEDGVRIISMLPLDDETRRWCKLGDAPRTEWIDAEQVVPRLRSRLATTAVPEEH